MVSGWYYDLLHCSPGASLAELKAAYHSAAKRNHPDLFPEEERQRYQMRMMQINEAYMAIICDRAERPVEETGAQTSAPDSPAVTRHIDPAPDTRALGHLKDPAYTYYKLGFEYFSEGRRTLSKHYLSNGQRIDFSVENIHVLHRAVASLHYFHKAYDCFERVSSAYPSSVWARDSAIKIYYLNRYNALYQRICDNLSKQIFSLKTERQERAVPL